MAICAFSADAPRASCGIMPSLSTAGPTRRGLLTAAVMVPIASATITLPTARCAASEAVERIHAHERAYPSGLDQSDPSPVAEDAWLARWRDLIAAVVTAQASGPAGLAAKLRLAISEEREDIAAAVAAQLEAMA